MTTRMSLFASQQVSGTCADGDYYGEDATFASLPNAKTAAEISQDPSRYLCALGYFSFASLIDIKSPTGTLYIHSASEPYNEEMVLNQERVDNWLTSLAWCGTRYIAPGTQRRSTCSIL